MKNAYLAFIEDKANYTVKDLLPILKELYDIHFKYESVEKTQYYLISKFKDKVSSRLLERYKVLRKLGEEGAKEMFKSLVYSKNPWLARLPKADTTGKYYPVPIKYGKD